MASSVATGSRQRGQHAAHHRSIANNSRLPAQRASAAAAAMRQSMQLRLAAESNTNAAAAECCAAF